MAEVEVLALDGDALAEFARLLVFAFECRGEARLDVVERDATLGPLRSGHRRHHRGEVERQRVGENGVGRTGLAPQALRLAVGGDQRDAVGVAAGHGEVADGLAIDREEAARRAVLRRHVGDGGAIGQRHRVEAGSVELDELVDHALLAQHLRHGQHEVGRGDALLEPAGELEADHLGDQHRLRLAEHGRLRLDAADAPAEHGEAVDHGGVAVGADQRIGIGDGGAVGHRVGPHRLRQIFEVDLVADAGAGRHHAEVLERALAPLEEVVAFAVALVFQRHVLGERFRRAELVDDDRMIDDEIDGHQRIDLLRVAAECGHAVAHRGEVDDRGNAGEVLHQHARRAKADFLAGLALVLGPGGQRHDVGAGDGAAVLVPQQVLQKDLHGERKLRCTHEAVLFSFGDRVIDVGLAFDVEGPAAFEAVQGEGSVSAHE